MEERDALPDPFSTNAIARRMFRPALTFAVRHDLESLTTDIYTGARLGFDDRDRFDWPLRRDPSFERRRRVEVRAADHSLWCLERLREQLAMIAASGRLAIDGRYRFARLRSDVHWRSRFEYAGREWRRARAADRARTAERGEQVPAADD